MTDEIYRDNLQYIQDAAARDAYARLRQFAVKAGLTVEFVPKAAARTMKLIGVVAGRPKYLFSADRGRNGFSFYIRKPATAQWPELLAHGHLHGGAIVDEEQVRIHVRNVEQIDEVWEWLEPKVQSAIRAHEGGKCQSEQRGRVV